MLNLKRNTFFYDLKRINVFLFSLIFIYFSTFALVLSLCPQNNLGPNQTLVEEELEKHKTIRDENFVCLYEITFYNQVIEYTYINSSLHPGYVPRIDRPPNTIS